jgi:hypothetical protein
MAAAALASITSSTDPKAMIRFRKSDRRMRGNKKQNDCELSERIDLVRPWGGPAPEMAKLAFDKPVNGLWASDHFGVVVDLEIGKQ